MDKIRYTFFGNMPLLNKWYEGCKDKVEIINIQYELRGCDDFHHVYYKVII